MGHHPGNRETDIRPMVVVVVPIVPIRILNNGDPAHGIKGNSLGALPGGCCQGEETVEGVGIADGPLESLHSAHGSADDGKKSFDPEAVRHQPMLGIHHVRDSHDGKVEIVGVARFGVYGRRTTGALAAANTIRANDKESGGVDRFTGSNDIVPPASFTVAEAMDAGGMVIATEGMTNENGIRFVRIQFTVGFVTEGKAGKLFAGFKAKRFMGDKVFPLHEAYFPGNVFKSAWF